MKYFFKVNNKDCIIDTDQMSYHFVGYVQGLQVKKARLFTTVFKEIYRIAYLGGTK